VLCRRYRRRSQPRDDADRPAPRPAALPEFIGASRLATDISSGRGSVSPRSGLGVVGGGQSGGADLAAAHPALVQDVAHRAERPLGELGQLAEAPTSDDVRSVMNASTRACEAGSGRGLAVPANSGSGRSWGRGG
jgi:hypothetical protein